MNVLITIIAILLVIVLVSFLAPWVSKKIEEPFVGGTANAATCTSAADVAVAASVGEDTTPEKAAEYADYVELGKQMYNRLGEVQPITRRAFDVGSPTMNLDNTKLPGTGKSPLQILNDTIRSALVNVDILPSVSDGPSPAITEVPVTADVPLGSTTKKVPIDYTYTTDKNGEPWKWNLFGASNSYVEERVPPRDASYQKAGYCEAITLSQTIGEDGRPAPRSAVLKGRVDLCGRLAESLDPLNSNKDLATCGVCIKERKGIAGNPDKVGGMFISDKDAAIDKAAAGTGSGAVRYKPSFGTCAPGYFFYGADQKDACIKAAQRLDCEEYGAAGGFSQSEKGKANPSCVACIPSVGAKPVYLHDNAASTVGNIRIRMVLPKGVGRTHIYVSVLPKGVSSETAPSSLVVDGKRLSADMIVSAKAEDTLIFKVVQEAPHRPERGTPEVFFVGIAGKSDANVAQGIAENLGCTVATVDQLTAAAANGAQVAEPGWAADGSMYTIHQFTGFASGTVEKGLVKVDAKDEATASAKAGVWCYGLKPAKTHLSDVADPAIKQPDIRNFYTWYGLSNEDGITASQKQPRFSQYQTPAVPQYRGIILQMERVPSTTAESTALEVRSEPAEPFLTEVLQGTQTVEFKEGMSRVEKLESYSRNGTFSSSERIVSPRASELPTFISDQYWIWSKNPASPLFSFRVLVPGLFHDPFFVEDGPVCSRGVLYTGARALNMMSMGACADGLQEDDRSGCMAALFSKMGGDPVAGTLGPNNPTRSTENRKQLMYKDYFVEGDVNPQPTEKRTVAEVEAYLQSIADVLTMKTDSVRNAPASERVKAVNKAAQQLLGVDRISPCQTVVQDRSALTIVPKRAPFDSECLNHLYRDPATYSDIGSRYSGIKPEESASDLDKQAFPYRTCQPAGTWAPIKPDGSANADGINALNKDITDIVGVVARLNKVFQDANMATNGVPASQAQELAIEQCYGVSKKKYVSNCYGLDADQIRVLSTTASVQAPTKVLVSYKDNPNKEIPTETPGQGLKEVKEVSDVSTGDIVQLLDSAGSIVAQKTATGSSVRFDVEDIRALLPYSNIAVKGVGQRFRLESLLYPGKFLTATGGFDSSGKGTVFELTENQSNMDVKNSPIYSIRDRSAGNRFLRGNPLDNSVAMGELKTAMDKSWASWSIMPAAGSRVFVVIESANYYGYYLVSGADSNAPAPAKAMIERTDLSTPLNQARMSWRLHPAD